MSKVAVTEHAVERFKQRVSSKGSHRQDFRKKVEEWCEHAMKHAKYIGTEGPNQCRLYRFSDFVLVLDAKDDKVVTIQPSAQSVGIPPEVELGLKETIKKQIVRMVRPQLIRQQEIIISINDYKLRRFRVHNPGTKESLKQRMIDAETQLDNVRKEINAYLQLAYQHGVKIDEEEI